VLKGDHLGAALLTFFYFVLLELVASVLLSFLENLVLTLVHFIVYSGFWWDHWRDVIFSFHAGFFLESFKHRPRLFR
jgi:pilus assembly protein TadC